MSAPSRERILKELGIEVWELPSDPRLLLGIAGLLLQIRNNLIEISIELKKAAYAEEGHRDETGRV